MIQGMIDTHCHVHFKDFDPDRAAVIDRALKAGVKALIAVGADPESNEKARRLRQPYPFIFNTAGFHPHYLEDKTEEDIQNYIDTVKQHRPFAIGEIGLDYFRSRTEPAKQKKLFAEFLHLAGATDLPVIVHSRDALDDTLEILKSEKKPSVRVVMHCFSYDAVTARRMADEGFYISFTGNVTYKNADKLIEAARGVPADRLLLETDAPYLSPQAYRGKRNEPAYLEALVSFLAEKLGSTPQDLAERTCRNAKIFFDLPQDI